MTSQPLIPISTAPAALSRRGVLQWSAMLSVGTLLAACGGGGEDAVVQPAPITPPPAPQEPPVVTPEVPAEVLPPDTVPDPQILKSENGVLEVHIHVRYAPVQEMTLPLPQAKMAAWADFPAPTQSMQVELRSLNGQYIAPTLLLHPGDTLKMWVHNELPPSPRSSPMEELNYQNHTNMHFHGLHVDPREVRPGVYGDYVVDHASAGIEPGQTRYHEIVLPENHSCGIFWYHPHLHGSTNSQVSSGMFGAIVVQPVSDPFRNSVPMRERVLFAHKLAVSDKGRIDTLEDTLFNAPRAFMLNGQYQPTFVMRPGEVQHWHLLNPSSFYPLNPVLEGHDLHIYGRDGIHYGGRYRVQNRAYVEKPMDMNDWPGNSLYPGGRLSMVVQASMVPGEYLLKACKCESWHHPAGDEKFEEVIAKLIVVGEPVSQPLPDAALLKRSSDFLPITDSELATGGGIQRSVHVAIMSKKDSLIAKEPATERWDHPSLGGVVFVVGNDGLMKGFSPFHSAVTLTQTVKLGAVEEWTIVNHNAYPHPFHIHVNNFYVVRVNDQAVEPYWADTLPVPPTFSANGPKGSITFRSRFEDFHGKFIWHCHALNHEDLGMMQAVEIIE